MTLNRSKGVPRSKSFYNANPAIIRPRSPARAIVLRPAPLPESEEPVALAAALVALTADPSLNVSEENFSKHRNSPTPVPAADPVVVAALVPAPEPVAAAPAEVDREKKCEPMQDDWQAAYDAVSSSEPLP